MQKKIMPILQCTVNFLNSLNLYQTLFQATRYYVIRAAATYPSQAYPSLSLKLAAIEYTCCF